MVRYLRINNLHDKDLVHLDLTVKANSSITIYDEGYNLENTDENLNITTFSNLFFSKIIYGFITKYYDECTFEEDEDGIVKLIDRFEFYEDCKLTYLSLVLGITSLLNNYDVDFPKTILNNGKALVYSYQLDSFIPGTSSSGGGTNDHTLLLNIGDYTHFEIDDHLESFSNPHFVTKEQILLGNVDNTSDINKPVSTAVQDQIDIINDNAYVHPTGDGNEHIPPNGTTNAGKFLMGTETPGVYTWEDVPGGEGYTIDSTNVNVSSDELQYIESDNLQGALVEIDFILANKIVFGEYTTNDVIEELSGDLYVFKEDKDGSWYVRYVHEVDIENMEIRHATRFNNPSIITYNEAYNNYNILNYSFLSDAI